MPRLKDSVKARTVAGNRIVTTVEQAAAKRADDEQAATERTVLSFADRLDITATELAARQQELSAQWGTAASLGDAFWGCAHTKLQESFNPPDFRRMHRIYAVLAEFAVDRGPSVWVPLRGYAITSGLRASAQTWPTDTQLRVAACRCPVCTPDHDRAMTLAAALTETWLPHTDCQQPPCSCDYTTVWPTGGVAVTV